MTQEQKKTEKKKETVENNEVKLTAVQYAETKGIRRLNTFLQKTYGKTTKTLKEWKTIFKAKKYV